MKRIKTASDLKIFLEAIAKESTIKAKRTLTEDLEQEIEYVSRGLSNAKKNQSGYSKYMQIFEVEEEEDEEEAKDAPAQDSNEKDEEDKDLAGSMSADIGKKKPANKAVISIPLVEQEPEFADIVKAIGWVRAGPSIKGDIQKELQTYIEKLDEPEKKALYTMLSSMANILHKEIPGEKGQDPEDPPLNLIIDDPEEVEKQDKETVASPDDAPIKVGKSQSLNEMRRIVRKLMEK
jgi:hypothetical protein